MAGSCCCCSEGSCFAWLKSSAGRGSLAADSPECCFSAAPEKTAAVAVVAVAVVSETDYSSVAVSAVLP